MFVRPGWMEDELRIGGQADFPPGEYGEDRGEKGGEEQGKVECSGDHAGYHAEDRPDHYAPDHSCAQRRPVPGTLHAQLA